MIPLHHDPEMDAFKKAVIELNREDFDSLLVKFELYVLGSYFFPIFLILWFRDMRDHMAVGSTLRDQFSWSCIPIAPSQERKAFHAACERWEQWQDQQQRKHASPYGRHQTRNSIDTPYVHGQEGSVFVDRNGIPKPDVIRGRSSLPDNTSAPRNSRISPSSAPPDQRLSRSIRVFAAWKP
jgi:hypothetical protein